MYERKEGHFVTLGKYIKVQEKLLLRVLHGCHILFPIIIFSTFARQKLNLLQYDFLCVFLVHLGGERRKSLCTAAHFCEHVYCTQHVLKLFFFHTNFQLLKHITM